MRNFAIGALVGLVVGVLTTLVAVAGWAGFESVRTPTQTAEACDLDTEGSGWCVQRRERHGLFEDSDELWFVQMREGTANPRVTTVAWPLAADDTLGASFGKRSIAVRGESGATASYPAAFYALD